MPRTHADPGLAGHRLRLRQRARTAGLAALPDYELLELYLFRTLPRGDVKPLAKALMARFGGLAEVMGAPEGELAQCPGIGDATALDLKIAQELAVAGVDDVSELPEAPITDLVTAPDSEL